MIGNHLRTYPKRTKGESLNRSNRRSTDTQILAQSPIRSGDCLRRAEEPPKTNLIAKKKTSITVLTLSRTGSDRRAVHAALAYEVATEHRGGALSIPSDLADPLFLERFLGASRSPKGADAAIMRLRRMRDGLHKHVILREGTLFELLQFGIVPAEIIVFSLRYAAHTAKEKAFAKWKGQAKKVLEMGKTFEAAAKACLDLQNSPFLLPMSRGRPAPNQTWRFFLGADGNPVPLKTPLQIQGHQLQVAKPSQAELWVSPIPPGVAGRLLKLAEDAVVISTILKKYAPSLKRAAGRPTSDREESFIKYWPEFVKYEEKQLGQPREPRQGTRMKNSRRHRTLDRQGCEIFNVTFQKAITPATFRRYRIDLK